MPTNADIVILNVDDDEAARYAKSRSLRHAGFTVAEAVSGYDALTKMKSLRPAIALLDIKLPDIDGIEVCGIIKRDYAGTLVLQTSATFVTGADRTRGLEGGADGYLTQPIEPDELVAAVRALLRIRAAEEKLRNLNETLEERVRARTHELAKANARLKNEMVQRQKAEAALVQAQKMEAVGQLTGGIAHDFNNLLTAVVGNLDLIRKRTDDPQILRLAGNAGKAVERGTKLTAQLLAFSRIQKLQMEPVDVNALITGMSGLLDQSIGAAITVTVALDGELPSAMTDPNQLELAILNLAINARDAMPDGGNLTITTAQERLEQADGDLLPGDYIRIGVIDSGCGMPAEVAARAFDPFFTTKPTGKGTGLGLSQVYSIAKQAGGTARIASQPGVGTTVNLWLSSARDERSRAKLEEEDDAPRGRAETVLLVDDDPDVRELADEYLTAMDYRVLNADQAEAALALLRQERPDILVIDFAMPGLNGADVARAAQGLHPGLPVLFITGYADTAALEEAVGRVPVLRKPFRPSGLAVAIREALDRRR